MMGRKTKEQTVRSSRSLVTLMMGRKDEGTGPGKGHVFKESSFFMSFAPDAGSKTTKTIGRSNVSNHPGTNLSSTGNHDTGTKVSSVSSKSGGGSSLGPDWSSNRSFVGRLAPNGKNQKKRVIIESECEVEQVFKQVKQHEKEQTIQKMGEKREAKEKEQEKEKQKMEEKEIKR